jgi:two-component system NtrC family sensor kinase
MASPTGFSLPDDADHLAELGRIAGALVHELKNPLGVILLNAELIATQNLAAIADPTARARTEKRLQRITDSSRDLQAIVQSFLAFARPGRPDPVAVDLNRLLGELIDSQAELDAAAQVTVTCHADPLLAAVPGDGLHLRSVFLNILTNARDALQARPEDRRILVVTRHVPGVARVVIANNGPPLPERIATRLFEPFTTGREGGTGLGLAIVKRLVELHHGTVTVSSDPQQGVSFTLEFPTPLGPAQAPPGLPAPAPLAGEASRQPHSKRKSAPRARAPRLPNPRTSGPPD